MKKIFTFFTLLILGVSSFAQMTGSFSITIDFDESDYDFTRNLHYFVPTDYDDSQSYKLVVGFRGGPHTDAGQFRNQLTFLADSIGAIILCPENEGHFWNAEGLTKQLFQYSLDTTMAMYNIDPEFIYLTGLSYGGRHAVIVSMDTDAGDIPPLRGVIPFAAGSEADLQPNYTSIGDFPPACICIGLSDSQNFINVSNNLNTEINSNGGASMLNEIPNVGHTVVFSTYPQEMMECITFIEAQYGTSSTPVLTKDESGIRVFPNPANEVIDISFEKEILIQSIFVKDMTGRILKEVNRNDRTIAVTNLPEGLLLLVIETEQGKIVEQFSVVR